MCSPDVIRMRYITKGGALWVGWCLDSLCGGSIMGSDGLVAVDLYLITQNTHNRQTSTSPVGFEPTFSAGERPQTHALDRAATGIGHLATYNTNITQYTNNSNQQYNAHLTHEPTYYKCFITN